MAAARSRTASSTQLTRRHFVLGIAGGAGPQPATTTLTLSGFAHERPPVTDFLGKRRLFWAAVILTVFVVFRGSANAKENVPDLGSVSEDVGKTKSSFMLRTEWGGVLKDTVYDGYGVSLLNLSQSRIIKSITSFVLRPAKWD